MPSQTKGKLRLLVDANIPFSADAFATFGRVEVVSGSDIVPGATCVQEADALVIRSVTPVDASLLQGTAVRFVGTATIGTDHVDTSYLGKTGVAFASAPGSNAESVVEYVLSALLTLAHRHDRPLRRLTAGVVGAGNVGGRLVPRLRALGLDVLVCDPPRARIERAGGFVSLDVVLAESDILTLHVPLTRTGPHATHHLLDRAALAKMKPEAWLVNAARGAVVDNSALLAALEQKTLGAAVLDVWENEPTPLAALVARAALATPHIAGYSFDGKVQGTIDMVRALEKWSGIPSTWDVAAALAPAPADRLLLDAPDSTLPEHTYLSALTRQLYPIEEDDRVMRALLDLPPEAHAAHFRTLRRDYPRRRRWSLFSVDGPVPETYREAVSEGLLIR